MDTARISNRTILGLIVVAVGVLLFLDNLGVGGVDGVWRWFPSVFVLLGLVMLVRNRFRNVFGPMLLIAVAAFIQISLLGGRIWEVFWPSLLIVIGLAVILGGIRGRKRAQAQPVDSDPPTDTSRINTFTMWASTDRNTEFGSFQGGEVTALMGGVKLDMRHAAVEDKPANLEVTCVMGEVKVRVPSDWNVQLENVTVLGETQDKRSHHQVTGGDVDLVITGTVLMGNLEIDD